MRLERESSPSFRASPSLSKKASSSPKRVNKARSLHLESIKNEKVGLFCKITEYQERIVDFLTKLE